MRVEELFARHQAELYRYATRFTGDPDLAEDVVQEAFVRLAVRPPARSIEVRAWLFRVVTTVAIDMARGNRRKLELLGIHADAVPVAAAATDAAHEMEREELRAKVRAALAELSERERAVLLLREEGFAHREIAEAVGTTTGSVGTMIARALEKLAARLDLDAEDVR